MKKKLELCDLEVASFVTGKNVLGGCPSLPTDWICEQVCSEETLCLSECCTDANRAC